MDIYQRITAAVIITAPVFIVLYDLAVYIFIGRGATITAVVQGWSRQYHEIPYAVGAGFFWLWLHLFFEVLIERAR